MDSTRDTKSMNNRLLRVRSSKRYLTIRDHCETPRERRDETVAEKKATGIYHNQTGKPQSHRWLTTTRPFYPRITIPCRLFADSPPAPRFPEFAPDNLQIAKRFRVSPRPSFLTRRPAVYSTEEEEGSVLRFVFRITRKWNLKPVGYVVRLQACENCPPHGRLLPTTSRTIDSANRNELLLSLFGYPFRKTVIPIGSGHFPIFRHFRQRKFDIEVS